MMIDNRRYCGNCGIALDVAGGCGVCKPSKTTNIHGDPAAVREQLEGQVTGATLTHAEASKRLAAIEARYRAAPTLPPVPVRVPLAARLRHLIDRLTTDHVSVAQSLEATVDLIDNGCYVQAFEVLLDGLEALPVTSKEIL
jgi:hypothetical protein